MLTLALPMSTTLLWLASLSFLTQGGLIALDEVLCHRRRQLPRWELIGHPIDTFFLVIFFLCLAVFDPSKAYARLLAAAVAGVSCLIITKDEWIHRRVASPFESWLHALLFVIHPVVVGSYYLIWIAEFPGSLKLFQASVAITLAFFSYQCWSGTKKWRLRATSKAKASVNNEFYGTLGDRWYHGEDHPIALLRAETKFNVQWILNEMPGLNAGRETTSFLDVGCGAGLLCNRLAEGGFRVTGLDHSLGAITTARKYDSSGQVHYVVGDAFHLPFPAKSFDVVTCLDMLEHVDQPARVVSEISRVLKPGGCFFFHTLNRTWQSYVIALKGVEIFVRNTPADLHLHRLFIKPSEMREFCLSNGLFPKAWTGLRPKLDASFWRLIATGLVDPNFSFLPTKSHAISYIGKAFKQGE